MDHKVVQLAAEFMLKAHEGEKRKGGAPYFTHPCDVLGQVMEWDIQNTTISAAALLHDVLENNKKIKREHIEKTFGKEIADVVDELTFIPPKDLPDRQTVADLKARYMASFRNKSLEALIVKLADRCCNVCDFYNNDPAYANIYFHKAESLYDAMVNRQSEIISVFGEAVWPRIKHTHSTLMQMIA